MPEDLVQCLPSDFDEWDQDSRTEWYENRISVSVDIEEEGISIKNGGYILQS